MGATYAQRKALGEYGERLAVGELRRRGLVILDRNWRCPAGELDIVARDGRVLVACEVKTRTSDRYGDPVEAITRQKADRLYRLLMTWAAAHTTRHVSARVDVVAVLLPTHGRADLTYYAGVS